MRFGIYSALCAVMILGTLNGSLARAEGPEVSDRSTEEQAAEAARAAHDDANTADALARIGRKRTDLSSAPDSNLNLLETGNAPATSLGSIRNGAITSSASDAFEALSTEPAPSRANIVKGLQSLDLNARIKGAQLVKALNSSDVAVQLALAKALLRENVSTARSAETDALSSLNIVDPGVLSILGQAAEHAQTLDSRIDALEILQGSHPFDVAASDLAHQFVSRIAAVRAQPTALYKRVLQRELLPLFQALTRQLPPGAIQAVFPDTGV